MKLLRRSLLVAGMAVLVFVPGVRSRADAPGANATAVQATAAQPVYHLPPEKLAQAIELSRIRNLLHFGDAFWGIAVLWLLLATGAAAAMESWVQQVTQRRWAQGLIFFTALLVVLAVTELPVDALGHIASRHYGISVQGWASWLGDLAKALGLSLVIAPGVMLLFQWMVRKWPRRYWLGMWAATLPLVVAGVFIEPLMEPLFYKYEPLASEHPALVAELEKVAARTGTNIPPERMFLMKASEKTNGLNAYVSGLGATKRIVVWDTTAGRVPDDEVMFIFGHESGHYVLHHIPKMLAGYFVGLFFVYWGCAGFAGWLARRFGGRWGLDAAAPLACRAGFVVLLFSITAASFALEPVDNGFSRHFEHEADVYGQEAIHGLVADPRKTAVAAFNALGEAWLEDPDPSPFIEFWEYNHPSTKTRAEFAAQYDPWKNGGRGKYFAK